MEDLKYVVSGVKRATPNNNINRRKVITPVCIVVDKSHSMSDKDGTSETRMTRLNKGLNSLVQQLKQMETERKTTEIAVVSYTAQGKIEQPFKNIAEVGAFSMNVESGRGSSGDITRGIEIALDLIEKRRSEIMKAEINYKTPWLVIMSDGKATITDYLNPQESAQFAERKKKYMGELSSRLGNKDKNKKLEILALLVKKKPPAGAARTTIKGYNDSCTELKSFIIGEVAAKWESTHRFVEFENLKGGFDEFFDKLSKSVDVGNADIYQTDAGEPKINKRFLEKFAKMDSVKEYEPKNEEVEGNLAEEENVEKIKISENDVYVIEFKEKESTEELIEKELVNDEPKEKELVEKVTFKEEPEEEEPEEEMDTADDDDFKIEIIKPYDDDPDDWDDI